MTYAPESLEGRFLAGDREAYGQVLRWISTVVTSPRFWRLRHEWLDLQQEALRRLLRSLQEGRFDAGLDFRAYVQGVARYTAFESFDPGLETVVVDDLDATFRDPSGGEDEAVARQMARHVLEQASGDCRRLFLEFFYERRTHDEIAAGLGVPVGTVKSRLSRCLDASHRMIHGGRGSRTGAPPPQSEPTRPARARPSSPEMEPPPGDTGAGDARAEGSQDAT
jgi:RNA polymerase sigma factor (sigma-70 family)